MVLPVGNIGSQPSAVCPLQTAQLKRTTLPKFKLPFRVAASNHNQWEKIKARPCHPSVALTKCVSSSELPTGSRAIPLGLPALLPSLCKGAPQLMPCSPISVQVSFPRCLTCNSHDGQSFYNLLVLLADTLFRVCTPIFMLEIGLKFSFLVKQLLFESYLQRF